MKYVAAYTLLCLSGKTDVCENDLQTFFKQVDSEFNMETAKTVVAALKGKQLHELVKNGLSKVGNIGGGSSGSGPADVKEVKEEVKEEEVKEEEEEDVDMGGMFDDDF